MVEWLRRFAFPGMSMSILGWRDADCRTAQLTGGDGPLPLVAALVCLFFGGEGATSELEYEALGPSIVLVDTTVPRYVLSLCENPKAIHPNRSSEGTE